MDSPGPTCQASPGWSGWRCGTRRPCAACGRSRASAGCGWVVVGGRASGRAGRRAGGWVGGCVPQCPHSLPQPLGEGFDLAEGAGLPRSLRWARGGVGRRSGRALQSLLTPRPAAGPLPVLRGLPPLGFEAALGADTPVPGGRATGALLARALHSPGGDARAAPAVALFAEPGDGARRAHRSPAPAGGQRLAPAECAKSCLLSSRGLALQRPCHCDSSVGPSPPSAGAAAGVQPQAAYPPARRLLGHA